MKHVEIFFMLSLWLMTTASRAQPSPYCDCRQVKEDALKSQFYSPVKAQRLVDGYCRLFVHPAKIYPKPYACREAIFSRLCEADEKKYIFYNEPFLDRLVTESAWGDQFVMAHEIAHHLLGHTERAFRLGVRQAVMDSVARNTAYVAKDRAGRRQRYSVSIPQRHLHELEADALGLWMIIQKGASRSDMQQIFDVLPGILSVYDRTVSTDSHPSLAIRQKLVERYWTKFENPAFAKRYAAIDDNQASNPLQKETQNFYAFQLLTADEEQLARFTATERSIRDSLSRRSRVSVELVLGGFGQLPALHRGNEPVAATGSYGLAGGIRVGVGAWYRPHRFEADLKAAGSTFTTQATLADGLRTVEQFRTTYLYVQPRYVYSRISRTARYAYRNTGWLATAGLSVSVPLAEQYVNHSAVVDRLPTQRPGFAPVVGVGYGVSNWQSRNGHFRLWLLYQPQPLRFAERPAEPVRAWLHTVSVDFSVRFW